MIDLIAFMGLIGLLFGVTLVIIGLQLHLQLRWLRAVLVPYFHSLAQFLNPEKK